MWVRIPPPELLDRDEAHVCFGAFKAAPRPGGHPCGNAYHALENAGHRPEVTRAYGLGPLPGILQTPGRREVKRLTGEYWVPVLVTDDGSVVKGSEEILGWARRNPPAAAVA